MIDSFLKYLEFERRYSPKTILSYKNDLSQLKKFLEEQEPGLSSENAHHSFIRSWIISLVESGMDSSSVNRKIACLRSYYKFLMRQEIIKKDPMSKIRILKTKKKLPHFVNENDITHLLEADPKDDSSHEGLRKKLILELLYGTGIRLSELINLKEAHIHLKERTIRVLGKRNKERVIPFTKNLVSLLENYRKVRNKEIVKQDHGFFFVTDSGAKMYPMFVQRMTKSAMRELKIEKKSPHVLRHTYATHLLNKGAEINAVKDLLGHSSLAATQVYTHNSIEKLKKVFDQAHPKA